MVSGRIPEGAAPLIRSAAVSNPTLFFVRAFQAALQQRGIEVDGEALDVDSLAARDKLPPGGDLRPLVRHRSEPLSAIGAAMLKGSRNLYAASVVRHPGLSCECRKPREGPGTRWCSDSITGPRALTRRPTKTITGTAEARSGP